MVAPTARTHAIITVHTNTNGETVFSARHTPAFSHMALNPDHQAMAPDVFVAYMNEREGAHFVFEHQPH